MTAVAFFVLIMAQGVWAQSTNRFTQSGGLTTTTNGIIRIKPVIVSLPDHPPTDTTTASIAYPLSATGNAQAGSPAADIGPATPPAWTRGIAASINDGDTAEHQARLKWAKSH